MRHVVRHSALTIAVAAALTTADAAHAATLELRLVAANYDPNTGTWTDTSGAGNHATQGNAAERPALATGATPTGQTAVRFDGDDDFVSLPNFLTGDLAAEVFVVIRNDVDTPANSGQTGLWDFGSDGTNSHYPWTDGVIYDEFGTTSRKTTLNRATPLNQYNVYNVRSETNLWESRLNNGEIFTTNSNAVGFSAAPKLGESEAPDAYNLDGDIAEIRIYTYDPSQGSGLTEAERTAIHNELRATYIVPEPGALGLMAMAALPMVARRRRR